VIPVQRFLRAVRRFFDAMPRLLGALERTPPPYVLITLATVGFAVALASFVVDVASVPVKRPVEQADGTAVEVVKQVGYVYAPNWFVSFVLFFPLALYHSVAALSTIPRMLGEFAGRGMLVGPDGKPVDPAVAQGQWTRIAAPILGVVVILGGLGGLAESLAEAYLSSPQLRPGGVQIGGEGFDWSQVDWSWRPVLPPPQSAFGRAACTLFTFCAFLAQAAAVAAFFLLLFLMVGFSALFFRFTDYQAAAGPPPSGGQPPAGPPAAPPIRLIPDVKSEDPRRGYESCELLVRRLLLAAVFFALAFFMTRLQRIYLRSASPSILAFVSDDIAEGFVRGVKDLFAGANATLFDPGGGISFGEAMTAAGLFVVIMLVFLIPASTLGQAARASRDYLLQKLRDPALDVHGRTGLDYDECAKRLNSMVFWPVKYPRLIELIFATVLALACFLYYRLALLLVGYFIFVAARRAVQALKDSSP
jgi:hypothetical protein